MLMSGAAYANSRLHAVKAEVLVLARYQLLYSTKIDCSSFWMVIVLRIGYFSGFRFI